MGKVHDILTIGNEETGQIITWNASLEICIDMHGLTNHCVPSLRTS